MFTCPVCFYAKMPDPPVDYNICPCCGTEFENHDELHNPTQLRNKWISRGAKWFFRSPPPTWNPWTQLAEAGVQLPYISLTAPVISVGFFSLPVKSITYGDVSHQVGSEPAPFAQAA